MWCQLVGQHPRGHRLGDVGPDPHQPGGRVGVAVRAPALAALDPVAVRVDLLGERGPHRGRHRPGERLRGDFG